MILHTHEKELDGEVELVYVLHVHPNEAKALADAVYVALGSSPDSESYNITLGKVSDLDGNQEEASDGGLILPGSGLATP